MAESLRDRIVSGELAVGTPLPTENTISKTLGIGISTVRSAYAADLRRTASEEAQLTLDKARTRDIFRVVIFYDLCQLIGLFYMILCIRLMFTAASIIGNKTELIFPTAGKCGRGQPLSG